MGVGGGKEINDPIERLILSYNAIMCIALCPFLDRLLLSPPSIISNCKYPTLTFDIFSSFGDGWMDRHSYIASEFANRLRLKESHFVCVVLLQQSIVDYRSEIN